MTLAHSYFWEKGVAYFVWKTSDLWSAWDQLRQRNSGAGCSNVGNIVKTSL